MASDFLQFPNKNIYNSYFLCLYPVYFLRFSTVSSSSVMAAYRDKCRYFLLVKAVVIVRNGYVAYIMFREDCRIQYNCAQVLLQLFKFLFYFMLFGVMLNTAVLLPTYLPPLPLIITVALPLFTLLI